MPCRPSPRLVTAFGVALAADWPARHPRTATRKVGGKRVRRLSRGESWFCADGIVGHATATAAACPTHLGTDPGARSARSSFRERSGPSPVRRGRPHVRRADTGDGGSRRACPKGQARMRLRQVGSWRPHAAVTTRPSARESRGRGGRPRPSHPLLSRSRTPGHPEAKREPGSLSGRVGHAAAVAVACPTTPLRPPQAPRRAQAGSRAFHGLSVWGSGDAVPGNPQAGRRRRR